MIAASNNFRFGSIVTAGKNERELDRNIKDAILTAFDIPSAYAKDAKLYHEGETAKAYAAA